MLAYLLGEPGADRVEAALAGVAAIGAANWAETLSKLAERGLDADAVAADLAGRGILGTGLIVVPLDDPQARTIARLRPLTRSAGLSLGDRAALALGLGLDLPVLTADRGWGALSVGARVDVIRPP